VVCQEICPYGAVELVQTPAHSVPAPRIEPARCYGCGFCEQSCPVRLAAVLVEPLGALRLNQDQYQAEARNRGLDLDPSARSLDEEMPEGQLPPGFIE
jgi:formate hydrogenlyase subunit 6/NADH:ubiquinone oxidoreductase subunit I